MPKAIPESFKQHTAYVKTVKVLMRKLKQEINIEKFIKIPSANYFLMTTTTDTNGDEQLVVGFFQGRHLNRTIQTKIYTADQLAEIFKNDVNKLLQGLINVTLVGIEGTLIKDKINVGDQPTSPFYEYNHDLINQLKEYANNPNNRLSIFTTCQNGNYIKSLLQYAFFQDLTESTCEDQLRTIISKIHVIKTANKAHRILENFASDPNIIATANTFLLYNPDFETIELQAANPPEVISYNSGNQEEIRIFKDDISKSKITVKEREWLTYDSSSDEEMSEKAETETTDNNNSTHFAGSQRMALNPAYVPCSFSCHLPSSQISNNDQSQTEATSTQSTLPSQLATPTLYQFSFGSHNG